VSGQSPGQVPKCSAPEQQLSPQNVGQSPGQVQSFSVAEQHESPQ
jgi:hypothetical protein